VRLAAEHLGRRPQRRLAATRPPRARRALRPRVINRTLQRAIAGTQQHRSRRDGTVHDANGVQVREPHHTVTDQIQQRAGRAVAVAAMH